MRPFFLILACFLSFYNFAQPKSYPDLLILNDGSTIRCKIKDVKGGTVIYKPSRWVIWQLPASSVDSIAAARYKTKFLATYFGRANFHYYSPFFRENVTQGMGIFGLRYGRLRGLKWQTFFDYHALLHSDFPAFSIGYGTQYSVFGNHYGKQQGYLGYQLHMNNVRYNNAPFFQHQFSMGWAYGFRPDHRAFAELSFARSIANINNATSVFFSIGYRWNKNLFNRYLKLNQKLL